MKYDFELDLNSNNSLAKISRMINPSSKVLEFGPATGRLTRYLKKQKQCKVFIVEIDEESAAIAAKYAQDSIIGDIEKYEWLEKYKEEKFDHIIFADVLEHLYNPQIVLAKCATLLNTEGSILISVPNIAHNSVVIDLLNNQFNYRDTGLLDDTHIRFFTYYSLKNMINQCDLIINNEDAVIKRVGETEIRNYFDNMPNSMKFFLKNRSLGDVYQFIFELKKKHVDTLKSADNISFVSNYYYSQLYIDSGQGFKEEESLVVDFNKGTNSLKFDLINSTQIGSLRFDPLNANCVMKLNAVKIEKMNGELIEISKIKSNADFKINDDTYVFTQSDPNIYIPINTQGTHFKSVTILFEILEMEFDSIELINKLGKTFDELKNIISNLTEENTFIKTKLDKSSLDNTKLRDEIDLQLMENKKSQVAIQDNILTIQKVTNEMGNVMEQLNLVEVSNSELKHKIDFMEDQLHQLEGQLHLKEKELLRIKSTKMWGLYSKIFLK